MKTIKRGRLPGPILFGAILALLPGKSDAALYYVSTAAGGDGVGSFARPWGSLAVAVEHLQAGDSLYLRGGTYHERLVLKGLKGGEKKPVLIRNFANEKVVLSGARLRVPEGGRTGLVEIRNCDHLHLRGLEVTDFRTTSAKAIPCGIQIEGKGKGIRVENCEVRRIEQNSPAENANGFGICVYGYLSTPIEDFVMKGNRIHHLRTGQSESVVLNGNVVDFLVRGNRVNNCNNIGIDFIGYEGTAPEGFDRARDGLCTENVVHDIDSSLNPGYGGSFTGGGGDRSAAGIYVDGGTGIQITRNEVYACNFGIELASEHSGKSTDMIEVSNNLIRNNHGPGIIMGGYDSKRGRTAECVISNNTIFRNDTDRTYGGQIGIQFYFEKNKIVNNIIWADKKTKQMIVHYVEGGSAAQRSFGPGNSPWEFTGAAGVSYADGNSESMAYSLQFLGSYIQDGEELYFGADYFYSEDGATKSTDSLKIHSQYNHSLTERFYLGGYAAYFRDSVADIGYRLDPSLLVGYRVIARDDLKLAFELGPGYTWQEQSGVESDFATLRLTEKFEWGFSDDSKVWQAVSFTPGVEDFSDYLLDFEAGIETRITAAWSLRTFLRHRIDSTPAVGKGRSDTSLILGLAYELGGLPEPGESGGRRSLMPGEEAESVTPKGWVSVAALGFTLNQGNSESTGLSFDWKTAWRDTEREFFFDLAQVYHEDNGETSKDQTSARVQLNHLMDERMYIGSKIGYFRDSAADIDYRVTPGILGGYKLIKTEETSLALEGGPSYTFESLGGVTDSYASVFVAERFTHRFNERFSFDQALEYTGELADLGNYSVLLTAGLDTKISDRLIWRIAGNYSYENEPAAGREEADASLTSAEGSQGENGGGGNKPENGVHRGGGRDGKRYRGSDGEHSAGCECGLIGAGAELLDDSDVIAGMRAECVVFHEFVGDLIGQFGVEASLAVDFREFPELAFAVVLEGVELNFQIGYFDVVLGSHGYVFAGGHGQGAGGQSRGAGQEQGFTAGTCHGDAGDEAGGGNESVVGTEDGGPEPSGAMDAEAISWLFGTQQFGIKLGLEGPRNLLKEFLAFPKYGVQVAHVAGTNGKGSTCAIMDRVARSCGRRTGLFTSPHLIDYRERMQVSGEMISEERCAELLSEIRVLCEGLEVHPTFFEITLAVAMRWFRERECELIILETGMGGRLDATTAVPADVCLITPVAMDHTQWLGDTLGKVAGEKAGIFLEGVPAFSAPQEREAEAVLRKEANERRTPLEFISEPLTGYGIALAGDHQSWNAALALAGLHALGIRLGSESVADGLEKVSWPGRFERIRCAGKEVILDGAHNPHAAEVLKATWGREIGEKKGTLIFGAVESKDIAGIFREFRGLTERVVFCKVGTMRGLPLEELTKVLPEEERAAAEGYESFSEAFAAAAGYEGPVLVAGSLFLIGEARAKLLGGDFLATRGDFQGIVDCDGDAAFSRAIELRDDEAIERAGFVEFLRLVHGVGAGGGVDDEEGLVGGAGILFRDGAADFPEFFHEVVTGVDAAGGITDEEIGVFLDGLLVGVEADGGRIGVWFPCDDGDIEAGAPALELLDGGGAEGIGGGEADGVAAVFQPEAQFCGGCCFPGAIDADDEDDGRLPVGAGSKRRGVFGKDVRESTTGDFHDVLAGNFTTEIVEFIDDGDALFRAEVGGDQIRLQFVPVDFHLVASQVAAGEVVERPASVVKELVENSLDAGAKSVMVDIERGGTGLIRVTDDGCGMVREDALLSLERHATSKLRTSEDLAKVLTLGFRGEAVPSIASVAKFRMATRREEDVSGTEIFVDGGKLRDVRDAGGAPGTVIEARNLFFNMPARRKFMRAESTEAAHVEQQIRLHALAAPGVRFRFRRDDRVVFDLPGVARTVDRVRQLLGNDLGAELVEMPERMGPGMSVMGFVLPAKHARKGRRHQFVFLNGRPIEDAAVSKGVAEGFRGNLQEGLHPAAWLWLELEPELVDVNVHPAKREVRFHRPYEVRDLISQAVTDCLRPAPAVKQDAFPREEARTPLAGKDMPAVGEAVVATRPMFHQIQAELAVDPPAEEAQPARKGPGFRLIGMLQERYVIFESEDGLVLFDPRAAKERIVFEKLTKGRREGLETQNLLVPVLMELDPRELDLLLRERMALMDAGVEIEEFGGNTLQVRSLPACLPMDDCSGYLDEVFSEMIHGPSSVGKFAFERLARILANKASLRLRPRISEAECLLEELFGMASQLYDRLGEVHEEFLKERGAALSGLSDPFGVPAAAKVVLEESEDDLRRAAAWKRNVVTTVFWVGEQPTENNPTPNDKSAWDQNWEANFGGYDDPNNREGYFPRSFVPALNPWEITYPSIVEDYIEIIPPSTVNPTEELDVEVRVLGNGVTVSSSNSKSYSFVDAQATISFDGGSYQQIFYGDNYDVNPSKVVWKKNNVQAGQKIRFGGRYYYKGWGTFYYSEDGKQNVRTLVDGSTPPTNIPSYGAPSLEDFIKPYIGANGKVDIGPMDVIVFMELTHTDNQQNDEGYDLQDLVLLVTFTSNNPKNNNGHGNNEDGKKPVYRDAETHDQIAKKLKAGNSHNPMKTLIPSEGEDPSVKNRPQDIISSSDVISFGGLTTLVPKKAIMQIPEIYADRINNHTPGNRIVGWFDFYRMNRAWITTVEVTRVQAEGREPIPEEVAENLEKNRNLIIATYSGIAQAQDSGDNFQNFVRQVQLPYDGSEGTVWNVEVESSGEQASPLEINPGGARFELHTVRSDPFEGFLLDTKYVSAYTPVAEVAIRTEDPYETVPRTRADRPFNVEITMYGLRDGEDDPEASKRVKILHHVQSYGEGGDGSGVDRTQASLIGQGYIEDNGEYTLSYLVSSVPASDLSKIRGEERFSVYSIEDYQAPESHLDSLFVQIWPVADGTISGISNGETIKFNAPTITMVVNDIYPDSQVYIQAYQGDEELGTEGVVLPGSAIVVKESVPQNRTITVDDWDDVITGDGTWTIELLTSTPFGIDRLDHVSFTVDRTISYALQQVLTDSYLTYERAYAQRMPFEDILADDSPWPLYPQTATETVEIGTLPGGVPVTGEITRTRMADTNNYPIDGGSGTVSSNPAAMKIWVTQSILRYTIAQRTYVKSRTVVRSQ
eukprot:g3587.t1